ncbi:MAG: hypothetical protein A3F09_04235 [Chlamydiae bacterium RIFCSPHIGHO2_12_FULL_49_11]|nr:MAG: hypothetical protein A3F09_04235 [Chlamydiae bacterium RIFCSPHIGHO2_12_FULL_49_11]
MKKKWNWLCERFESRSVLFWVTFLLITVLAGCGTFFLSGLRGRLDQYYFLFLILLQILFLAGRDKPAKWLLALFLSAMTVYLVKRWGEMTPHQLLYFVSINSLFVLFYLVQAEARLVATAADTERAELLSDRDLWKTRFDSIGFKQEKDEVRFQELTETLHEEKEKEVSRLKEEMQRLREIYQEKESLAGQEMEDLWTFLKEKEVECAILQKKLRERIRELNHLRPDYLQKTLLLRDEKSHQHKKEALFKDPRKISFPLRPKSRPITLDSLRTSLK